MATIDFSDDTAVVIVGSGAGGGTLANELCQKGIKCVILEAGKRYAIADFVNDEMTMAGKLTWLDKRTMTGSGLTALHRPSPAWICKTVGGTTVHWAGNCPRFQHYELQARTTYGDIDNATLIDWPLTLAELEPYYEKAEDKMGITSTHGIPRLPGNNNFNVLYEGAQRLGYQNVHTGRMAINSRPRDGRAGCQQLGFCFQGCKSGAKWSTLYSEIPKAEATGRLDLRSESMVLRIEHNAEGQVTGVLYADSDGQQHFQKARVVAVAGNAIETPRLLLNSASGQFPNGLANSSDQVGRNYMIHTTGSVFALFERPVNMHRGTTMAGIVEDEARHDPSRGFASGYHLETLALGLPFLAGSWPGKWGRDLTELLENYDHLAGLWICGEDMPMAEKRVTLNDAEKDPYGLPVANVHIDDHPNDAAMVQHAYQQATALYEAVGAKRVETVPPFPAGHNLGTARMSASAEEGVVNRWGQSHDIANLFVSDGSQFSTGGAPNPTVTIVALAIRQADYLAKQMKAGAL